MGHVKLEMDPYPQAIWEISINAEFFLQNLLPCTAKSVFSERKGSPFGLKKIFFSNCSKSLFYQSHFLAFGLTIPKWYNTWVLKILLKIFWKIFEKNVLKNIFEKNIYKKYFQYLSVIPFWNRETECHNMALIKTWFEDFFFQHPKGGPFGFSKTVFAVPGGN